ncbi:class I SAM-dependent methyltransferase [Microlunatus soli]|uniref:Methyltransferase domain-containing protein n=1 Tax=Microlunatus soli TaxID=630515 RepID=A0A1H1YU64_9ACTN|nr:class I SAM-dependent methyltransferase [Microlunatus soli]SDT25065.1 Methyltransferase domain-containing protein [Microlunatus soli]
MALAVLDRVTGIELDKRAAEVAQSRFADDARVQVCQASFDDRPSGTWDLVTLVAVLHHLPLQRTLVDAKALVNPGGRLVVVGLSRDSPGLWSLISILLNPLVGMLAHPRGDGASPQSAIAPARPATESLAEIRAVATNVLPGVQVRTGPFWRYTLVWTA